MAKKTTESKAVPGTDQAKKATSETAPKTIASPDTKQGMQEEQPKRPSLTTFEEVGDFKPETGELVKQMESSEKFSELTEEGLMKALEDQARGEQINEDPDKVKTVNVGELTESQFEKALDNLVKKEDVPPEDAKFYSPSNDIRAVETDAELVEQAKSPFNTEKLKERIAELENAPKTTLKTLERDLAHNEEDLYKTKRIVASEVLGKIRSGNYATLTMPHKWLVHVLNFPGVLHNPHENTIVYEGKQVNYIINNDVEDYILTGDQQ